MGTFIRPDDLSGTRQALTSSPNLLTGFVRTLPGFSETSPVWSGPGKGLGKSWTAFGETVPVWAKRCQFLRKPVPVWPGAGGDLPEAGTRPAKRVPFRGKTVPVWVEDATLGANASLFWETGTDFRRRKQAGSRGLNNAQARRSVRRKVHNWKDRGRHGGPSLQRRQNVDGIRSAFATLRRD
jgi:hypothetical protein